MASSSSEPSADSTSDLATLISNGKFDEVLLHQYADEGLLDVPDKEGRTPLMFACLKGRKDAVRFLLANGANPNSSCLKEGNTPMHYACTLEHPKGENVFRRRYRPWKWTDTKIPIIELLLSSGATERENLNGWTPLCVAAFYILMHVVDFFFYRDDAKIPLEVETKVTEILAVSDVICYPHFKFDIKRAFDRFSKAIGFRHRQGATRLKAQVETSELAACFLKMSLQECHTAEEIELIRESEVGLKVHAFLVGDRLYPKKIKQKYLYPSLVTFGCDLMWKLNMLEEGRQVLSCAIRFDHRGEFCLGSVVENFKFRLCKSFVKEDEGPNDQYFQYVQDLLCEIESILNRVHIDSLSDHSDSLMDIFAEILFNEAFFCSTINILRSTLQTIERSMLVIRGRIRVENPDKYHELLSVTYKVMDFLELEFIGTLFDESDVVHSRSLLRVMFVIRKILFFDNVSYRDRKNGNTLLHILFSNYFMSDPQHQEYFIDLAWAFVRHGCPIDVVNKDGKTAKDTLLRRKMHLEESDHRLLAVVSPPTTVLSLEEIAIRQILRKNISYLGKIPTRLNGVIEGGLKDSDLEKTNDESDNDEERE